MADSNSTPKVSFEASNKPLLHSLEEGRSKLNIKMATGAGLIILLGLVSGYILSNVLPSQISELGSSPLQLTSSKSSVVVGSSDTKTFRDSAEGQLDIGGINGEGTHKLIRAGGESQTVYLTSSILDLNQFVGKKVRVWGETFSAKKAAWLMDVGKVEVIGD